MFSLLEQPWLESCARISFVNEMSIALEPTFQYVCTALAGRAALKIFSGGLQRPLEKTMADLASVKIDYHSSFQDIFTF